jgi:hypothetical protein
LTQILLMALPCWELRRPSLAAIAPYEITSSTDKDACTAATKEERRGPIASLIPIIPALSTVLTAWNEHEHCLGIRKLNKLLTSATAVMQICRPSEIAGIAYLGYVKFVIWRLKHDIHWLELIGPSRATKQHALRLLTRRNI